MLTTKEEDRLEAVLPTTGLSISYGGKTYQYDLDVHWSGGDVAGDDASESTEYPALVLGWNSQNNAETQRQPANDLHDIDNPLDEPGLTETDTTEVSDELSVTIAVRSTHDSNGVPPQVRATQLTRELWRVLDNEIDINNQGPNGERPIRVETNTSPTPSRVERTYRYQWAISLHHAERFETDYETASDAEFSAEQTNN